jgi:Domain of unknown function (DUF4129)
MVPVSPRKLHLFVLLAGIFAAVPMFALKESSVTEYTAHLEHLRTVVQNCEADAAACDPASVGDDDQVTLAGLGAGANVNQFGAHYNWLRNLLKDARDPKAKDRERNLSVAESRLEDGLRDAGARSNPSGLGEARQKADAILRHPEFATVEQEGIWDRLIARFFMWLDRLFGNVAKLGEHSPWVGPVLEWGLVTLALVGLTVWAMRVLQRQRLAMRVESSRQIESWEEASRSWRSLAEEQAARNDWREAVHCLYWASIVMLEGRHFWGPSRSRTPREYVALLESGSQRKTLLRQQTLAFERIWYGLNPASEADYRGALDLHAQLRAA